MGNPPPAPRPRGNSACGDRGVVAATENHGALVAQRCALRLLDRFGDRIPVYADRSARSKVVGWINRADDRHWFIGESRGGRYAEGRDINTNWAFTQADNAEWGWMPGVFLAVGGNGVSDPSLASCRARCRPY